jgi:hypothetical protein
MHECYSLMISIEWSSAFQVELVKWDDVAGGIISFYYVLSLSDVMCQVNSSILEAEVAYS